ncbi:MULTISPECIES: hypothetical protein [Actinomadura]|uniref:Matrixin n=1 Tax=Actinomadura yumaensis TaxID=111807 RepID=A0ABW2CUT8_9ACTN|nr:hypothetical protein [Actinomadura sp. J1-007]MWK35079.1 hypothetical protein [Actinomadura sp. J1-007]
MIAAPVDGGEAVAVDSSFGRFVGGTLGVAVVAAALGVTAAADSRRWSPPAWCRPSAPLTTASLPRSVEFAECDLRGRVVRGTNGLAARVPYGGVSVTAHSLRVNGANELSLDVDLAAGTVKVSERTFPDSTPIGEGAGRDPCGDSAYALSTSHWPKGTTIGWRYYKGTAEKTGLADKRAFGAVATGIAHATDASTNCVKGRRFRPKPDIGQRYEGPTSAPPGINDNGSCEEKDGVSSLGWAALPDLSPSILAATCVWHYNGVTQESDILLQTYRKQWWTAAASGEDDDGEEAADRMAGCPTGRYEPAAVVTHESLHALGLAHIGGAEHARLTMSPFTRTCDDGAATLGLGDYKGLMKLYGDPNA